MRCLPTAMSLTVTATFATQHTEIKARTAHLPAWCLWSAWRLFTVARGVTHTEDSRMAGVPATAATVATDEGTDTVQLHNTSLT